MRFSTSFFHDSNQSGPLIKRLKYFRFRFRRDIRFIKNLRGVRLCSVCIILYTVQWRKIPQWALYRGVWLRGKYHTADCSDIWLTCDSQTNDKPYLFFINHNIYPTFEKGNGFNGFNFDILFNRWPLSKTLRGASYRRVGLTGLCCCMVSFKGTIK